MHRSQLLDELTTFDRTRLRPTSNSPVRKHEKSEHPKSLLLLDISRQFNRPENSDISIITNDDKIVYVSSFILQARSPYFERLLKSGMKESNSKEINVSASYDACVALFRYFYTDRLETNPKTAIEVMMLADMYLLEGLKHECESFVKKSITIETAIDFYEWSKGQFVELSYYVSKFIWKNIGKISRSPQFRNLVAVNSELLIELLNELPEKAHITY
mmetsp:Transcript_1088/g.1093  ORF Transcript_1088/g.1093 Transcript_1088/m.1093 type:complete len:217 (-) Transcript_1088:28-678(-)